MNFPLEYTGEIVFYKPDEFKIEQFILLLRNDVQSDSNNSDSISWLSTNSYTKLPVKISLNIIDDNTSISCRYKISMFENNVVLIFGVVMALFMNYNDSLLGTFIPILGGILFYLLNTIKISNGVKGLIYSYISIDKDIGEPELWQMQQLWMKDKTRCPACGEPKNPYSHKCVNCGVYYSKKQKATPNGNSNITNNLSVNYQLPPKKK